MKLLIRLKGFEEIKLTKTKIDFVPNTWGALANHAAHLETTWSKSKALIKSGKLDPLIKEAIALAVSISNGCNY